MPESRRRKRKNRSSSRHKPAKTGLSKRAKIITVAVIAALALVFVLSIVLKNNNKTATSPPIVPGVEQTTASGLKYIDEVEGTGASPQPGKKVTVHYTGKLADGTVFESSVQNNQPLTFTIGKGEVIKGWDEGVMSMKVGGKRQLIIPPELGYGAKGDPPKIPPNATLYFEVELLSVK